MSSRPQYNPTKVITNGDMSGNLTSLPTIIQKLTCISYEVTWTGSPVGTFQAQVSNNYSLNEDGSVRNAGDWVDIPLTGTPAAAGTPDFGIIDILGSSCYAIRLHYTRTSGSGTLQATVNAKVS